MSKRDDFITVIRTLRAASSTITDEQRIGLLRQATQQYGLSLEAADQILKDSGLVIGESVNYFEVLGISVKDIQNLTEPAIAAQVDAAHHKRYRASLNAGGRIRPDGKTEEQWRNILNKAKAALIDPKKRQAHIAGIDPEKQQEHIPEPEREAASYLKIETARKLILQGFSGQVSVRTRDIVAYVGLHHCEGIRELSPNEKQIIQDALTSLRKKGRADNPTRGYWSLNTPYSTE